MRPTIFLHFLVGILVSLSAICTINAEDPYLYYTWTVSYGLVSPLGIPQKVNWLLTPLFVIQFCCVFLVLN